MQFKKIHAGINAIYGPKEPGAKYLIELIEHIETTPVSYEAIVIENSDPPSVLGVYLDGHPKRKVPDEVMSVFSGSVLPKKVKIALGLVSKESINIDEVGDCLKALREERGLTKSAVAKRMQESRLNNTVGTIVGFISYLERCAGSQIEGDFAWSNEYELFKLSVYAEALDLSEPERDQLLSMCHAIDPDFQLDVANYRNYL